MQHRCVNNEKRQNKFCLFCCRYKMGNSNSTVQINLLASIVGSIALTLILYGIITLFFGPNRVLAVIMLLIGLLIFYIISRRFIF